MQSFDPALIPNFKVRGLALALPSTGTRIDGTAVARDLPLNFHPAAFRASTNVTPFGAVSVPA
jgi:hypothetical protein